MYDDDDYDDDNGYDYNQDYDFFMWTPDTPMDGYEDEYDRGYDDYDDRYGSDSANAPVYVVEPQSEPVHCYCDGYGADYGCDGYECECGNVRNPPDFDDEPYDPAELDLFDDYSLWDRVSSASREYKSDCHLAVKGMAGALAALAAADYLSRQERYRWMRYIRQSPRLSAHMGHHFAYRPTFGLNLRGDIEALGRCHARMCDERYKTGTNIVLYAAFALILFGCLFLVLEGTDMLYESLYGPLFRQLLDNYYSHH